MSEQAESPTVGECYFDGNGRKVELVAVADGGFIVAPIVRYPSGWGYDEDEDENDAEEKSGALEIVPSLFPTAPVEIYDEQIADLRAKIAEDSEVLRTLQDDIRGATAERRALLDKLKQVPVLKQIEAAVDKKITHIVSCSYGPPYEIGTAEEVLGSRDRFSNGLKLLTLFGNSKGDLQWRISHHSDGSGGSSEAWAFTSEEEALEFLRKRISDEIVLHSGGNPEARPRYLIALCRQALELGVAIPNHVLKMERAEARKVAEHQLSEARRDALRAQERLAQVEAESQPLLSPAVAAALGK